MSSRFKKNSFSHGEGDKFAVLITNLGTPEAPSKKALKTYLAQFLSDRRVVEIPRLLWLAILHLIILRIRPSKSAKAYQTVWTDRGSPLMFHTQDQCMKLDRALKDKYGEQVSVDFAMRYGSPSVSSKLDKLCNNGARKLLVLPLYPQYSGSTTGSTFDAVAADFTQRRWVPEFRFINHYHDHPLFIDAIASSISSYWQQNGRPEKLVFSYHGVPLKYLHDGDPYHCQCLATTRLIAQRLELKEHEYLSTFQSRFGKATWLKPYTDKTLQELGASGTKHVQVICPGFSSDCLETIEEIGEENREYFLDAGGEKFEYIPALNATDAHIHFLTQLVDENIQGWPQTIDSQEKPEQKKRYAGCPHNRQL